LPLGDFIFSQVEILQTNLMARPFIGISIPEGIPADDNIAVFFNVVKVPTPILKLDFNGLLKKGDGDVAPVIPLFLP